MRSHKERKEATLRWRSKGAGPLGSSAGRRLVTELCLYQEYLISVRILKIKPLYA